MSKRRVFDLVAFDGDDTLWHNERSYRDGRTRFREILATAGIALSEDQVEACVNETEVRNLSFYGYGVSNFMLSLIETAIALSDSRIPARHITEIIDLARTMITSDIELFPSVEPTLKTLARHYPLMLITKGDLLHQRSKLARSGLERHFQFVEVVSHKTPEVYRAILERHAIEPARFLMVGNSLRSDILPVVAIGGRAVHIPAALSWSHEHAQVSKAARRRYDECESLKGFAVFVESLGGVPGGRDGKRVAGRQVPTTRQPSARRRTAAASRKR